ncbi:nickel-dependent lactate racemase [candidate division WOR-3 bacterium]|nr:nickel-dependent lactate racemase [candidate division WOR-3 bacterium]
MRFKFGTAVSECTIPDQNVLGIIEPHPVQVRPLEEMMKQSLLEPIGKPRLRTMVRNDRPGDVVIIVSDRTRHIAHYAKILELLISELVDAGVDERAIECMVALGTHRRHTDEENRRLYGGLVDTVRISFHDCHKDLVSIGTTSTGLAVFVNKRAYNAEFVIATGKINFHYMAGYSGGRKAVLPGIAGYDTIRGNHCKLRRDGVAQGVVEGNIIAQEMDEAAHFFGLDYLVNMVENPSNETCGIFCGDPFNAFMQGCGSFKKQRFVTVPERADCAVVSSGGDPGDQNFYAGHKAINNVIPVVKPGGVIVLVAQCAQGVGNDAFQELLSDRTIDDLLCTPEHMITIGGHRAYQTARLLRDYTIIVVSDLKENLLSNMKFNVVSNISAAMQQVKDRIGDDFTCYVVPDGHTVMPVMDNAMQ